MSFRTPYDLWAKLLLSEICEGKGSYGVETEVVVSPRRVDFWYQPDGVSTLPGIFGPLLGAGPTVVEFYHQAPAATAWLQCIQKQVAMQSWLKTEHPWMYLISAGRPNGLIHEGRLAPVPQWMRGFYELAPLYRARLVVVSELPRERDTLLLRLLGSGRTLREAEQELAALPALCWEHQTAARLMPILALQLNPKEEIPMMQPYQQLYDNWVQRQQAIGEAKGEARGEARGATLGELRGIRESLIQLYRIRFACEEAELPAALQAIEGAEPLRALLPLFAQGTREEIRAALQGR